MAKKIDTAMIQGYAEMTAEEKVKALEALTLPDPDYTGYVKKDLYDKAASDLADWKRKHNALLSEEERKKQEESEQLEDLKKKLADLQREKNITDTAARYIAMGYDNKLAISTATALLDGDLETAFKNQESFNEQLKKKTVTEAMRGTSYPPAGASTSGVIDYQKKIDEAMANRDTASAVAYMRMQAEQASAAK